MTLRNPWALDVISRIKASHPDMVIGAGTVLEEGQIEAARESGADFAVMPGLDELTICAAKRAGLLAIPGVSNPTEIMAARRMGLRMLKFFPAEQSGGVSALKLYHGPFPDISFLPTGGMTEETIGDYLALPYVAACGGSFLAKGDWIGNGEWERIADACRRCREAVWEARR